MKTHCLLCDYINEMTKEIIGDMSQCTLLSRKYTGLFQCTAGNSKMWDLTISLE